MVVAVASPAAAGEEGHGNATRGKVLFMQCAACHSVAEGAPHKIGPNLYGVVGAPVGKQDAYLYSPAMAEAGAAGKAWTRETLDAFLADPRGALPNNRMAYGGISEEAKRRDIIAYLESLQSAHLK
jgi:cytochrome c